MSRFLSSRICACGSCSNVKNGSSERVAKFVSSRKDSAEKVSSSPDRVSVGRPTSFSSDRVPRWEVPSASGSGSLCPSLSYVRARGSALAKAASRALARVGTRSSVAARFVRVTAESQLQSSGTLALVVREV